MVSEFKPVVLPGLRAYIPYMTLRICIALALVFATLTAAQADDKIGSVSTRWRALTPNDKLAISVFDDPKIQGVSCYVTQPEKGGVKGTLGLAEEVSDVSIACRQTGPITFLKPLKQGEVVFKDSRSFLFKKLQVVRFWDDARNTLIYLSYSDKIIEGSPKNSTSAVTAMPWGTQMPAKPDVKD